MDGGPAALVEGTLVQEGQCLFLVDSEGVRRLPIWPPGVRLEGSDLVEGRDLLTAVGDHVGLGGGEYTEEDRAFLETLLESPIPPGCGVGRYWLVVEVIPAERLNEFR